MPIHIIKFDLHSSEVLFSKVNYPEKGAEDDTWDSNLCTHSKILDQHPG